MNSWFRSARSKNLRLPPSTLLLPFYMKM